MIYTSRVMMRVVLRVRAGPVIVEVEVEVLQMKSMTSHLLTITITVTVTVTIRVAATVTYLGRREAPQTWHIPRTATCMTGERVN